MKKRLHLIIVLMSLSVFAFAQSYTGIVDGLPQDSTVYNFGVAGSFNTDTNFVVDTTGAMLWAIGNTTKPFFADSTPVAGIMTDTANAYPVNANDWFTVKVTLGLNTIVDFWHKYQTDTMHDGGIVEYSTDSGITWQNIKGPCNNDSSLYPGIKTYNFYAQTDTLLTGEACFNGTSNGEMFSRIQFFRGIPLKQTNSDTACYFSSPIVYLRFRFVSDSIADPLSGWMIDSMKFENDFYSGAVPQVQVNKLNIYPNPAIDGQFIFPAITDEKQYTIEVTNVLGKTLFHLPYTHHINLSQYAKGIYFYKVTNRTEYYTGQLITQ